MKKQYTVSLAFVDWETMIIEADSPEEALAIARESELEGTWDAPSTCRERMEEDDTVYGVGGTETSTKVMTYIRRKRESIERSIVPNFDNTRQIAIIWDIDDVRHERPYLTKAQAMEVLENVHRKHDATLGVSWETLQIHSDMMFSFDPPCAEESFLDCQHKVMHKDWECNPLKCPSRGAPRLVFYAYDVWGNREDGWEVNDRQQVGAATIYAFTDGNEDDKILESVRKLYGFDVKEIEIFENSDEHVIMFQNKETKKPLGEYVVEEV